MNDENKKEYELACLITSPEAQKELADLFREYEAEVFFESPINEVKLAYKIKKNSSALFGFYKLRSNPDAIAGLNNALRLKQNILRFLIVTPPVKVQTQQPRQEKKPAPPVMSNEMLSEKLEEILK